MKNYKNKQGGSVMCDCTQGYDPAHPQFRHNCLPNEEQIENPKNSSNFQKMEYEQKDSLYSKSFCRVNLTQ